MKRHRSHTKQIVLLLLCIEILAVAGLLAYLQLRPMVVDTVTLEAGGAVPAVEDFLLYKNRTADFVTDIDRLTDPGTYEVKIKVGKRIHISKLNIVDTKAPTATVVEQMALRDDKVEPLSFLSDIKDGTDVTVNFMEQPDTSTPGEKQVGLRLMDQGGNITELYAALTVLDIASSVTVEAGGVMNITAKDFVDNNKYEVTLVTDLDKLDITKPGAHEIRINVNGREVKAGITVVDTTPPKAVTINCQVWQGEILPAQAFLQSIEDVSGVTAVFKTEPDFSRIGDQEVSIILKDDYGNVSEQTAKLTVAEDREPPKIVGTKNKTVFIGDGVAYRKGVYATDNRDQELKVSVDSSAVNLKEVGVYDVVYTAEDTAGNEAKVITTISVIKFVVSQVMVDEKADEILAEIITADMTKYDKAAEIYHWIKTHVGYVGDSDKTNWLAEAYRAMKDGEGDCFTFYAIAQELLTRAGIDSMQVTRLGGQTRHYWNLIDCGEGWYHFDCCPNRDRVETFMLTDEELKAFDHTRGSYYYNRDISLYPETPEVSVQSKVKVKPKYEN